MKGYVIKYTKDFEDKYYTMTKGIQQQVFFSIRGVKSSLGSIVYYNNEYKNWEDVIKKRGIEIWKVDIKPVKKVL